MTLADQQAALLAALAGNGPVPAGFDAARVRAAADALAFKRARAVAKMWPSLHAMLGDDFRERFAAYAGTTPLPVHGGPLADGRYFARFLANRVQLSDEAKLQVLSIDTRYRVTASGLISRRLPSLHAAWLRNSGYAVVTFGARRWRLRLPRSGR
jgi:hypothetical protein